MQILLKPCRFRKKKVVASLYLTLLFLSMLLCEGNLRKSMKQKAKYPPKIKLLIISPFSYSKTMCWGEVMNNTMKSLTPEVHPGLLRTSEMEHFTIIFNVFYLLAIVVKLSILDVFRGSGYAAVLWICSMKIWWCQRGIKLHHTYLTGSSIYLWM